jgi:CelD/BcsL family acetyltransferase involved in cellulose biosynthesis
MRRKLSNLTVEWISDPTSFGSLAAAWNSLASATDPSSAFLLHEWHVSAWRWLSWQTSLAVMHARDGQRTVGILPLVRERYASRCGVVTRLRTLDIPDTQQVSLLCAAQDADAVAGAVVGELMRTRYERTSLQLRRLYRTPANAALIAHVMRQRRVLTRSADTCPCVLLHDTWDAYYSRRSRRLKKGNNLIANRLRKAFGSVEVARTVLDPTAAGDRALVELIELSANSWKRNLDTALYRQSPRDWVQEMQRLIGKRGALVMWSLRLDGALAAAELQLDYAGVVSALRAEVREDLQAHGPGTYLSWKVLEALMGVGRTVYNMGPGLNEYKARWAEHYEELSLIDWYSPTPRGQLLWIADGRLRPALARLRRLLLPEPSIADRAADAPE